MTTKIFKIFDCLHRNFIEVTLRDAKKAEIQEFDEQCKKYIRDAETHEPNFDDVEHWHWNWNRKLNWGGKSTNVVGLFTLNGQCQGLMMWLLHSNGVQRGWSVNDMFEIKYLHVAPWNDSRKKRPRGFEKRYALVGVGLLWYAIEKSKELGCKGGIGLDALPQAEDWYKTQKFSHTGSGEDNLPRYELTESAANSWLAETLA